VCAVNTDICAVILLQWNLVVMNSKNNKIKCKWIFLVLYHFTVYIFKLKCCLVMKTVVWCRKNPLRSEKISSFVKIKSLNNVTNTTKFVSSFVRRGRKDKRVARDRKECVLWRNTRMCTMVMATVFHGRSVMN
jgi:hypothetical protein